MKAVIAVLLVGAFLMMRGATPKTRGILNNNPGNIKRTTDQWRGLVMPQRDPYFFQFAQPVWGIRAMARVLKNYSARYGLDTVREIVTRWAPPTENDTEAYIAAVTSRLNLDPNVPMNVTANLPKLIAAIIQQENGQNPYPAALVQQAIAMS